MASPEGVQVLTMVTGAILAVDPAAWADGMDNDPIGLDLEDCAPITNPQTVAISRAPERLHVVGEAVRILCVETQLLADQVFGRPRHPAQASGCRTGEDQASAGILGHPALIPSSEPVDPVQSLA